MNSFIKISTLGALLALTPAIASAAILSVSPTSQTVKVGEVFTVTVKLDTQGEAIDGGVDLRFLNFNAQTLQVQDSNPNKDGVQIGAESLMPTTILNSVDNAAGKITFSQVVAGGSTFKGAGNLATIKFKAIKAGMSNLTFDYKIGETRDTNVAGNRKDLLSQVVNGEVTITGTTGQAQTNTNTTKTNTNVSGSASQTGGTVSSGSTTELPAGDDTAFQFSEKKSFWQMIISLIVDSWNGFTSRVSSILGK
jgi:hypothetical protein